MESNKNEAYWYDTGLEWETSFIDFSPLFLPGHPNDYKPTMILEF